MLLSNGNKLLSNNLFSYIYNVSDKIRSENSILRSKIESLEYQTSLYLVEEFLKASIMSEVVDDISTAICSEAVLFQLEPIDNDNDSDTVINSRSNTVISPTTPAHSANSTPINENLSRSNFTHQNISPNTPNEIKESDQHPITYSNIPILSNIDTPSNISISSQNKYIVDIGIVDSSTYNIITKGSVFVKKSPMGFKRFRTIKISEDLRYLFWADKGSVKSKFIPLACFERSFRIIFFIYLFIYFLNFKF